MATYRELLDAVILNQDTTNAAAIAIAADPARVAAALAHMAQSGAIVPALEGTTQQHRWLLADGVGYHHAREAIERLGIVLDNPLP